MRQAKGTGDHPAEGGAVTLPRVGISLAALATVATATAADGWTRYSDPRFGAAADVPPGFTAGERPAEGGGLEFTGADGRARIAIYGLPNVESQRLKEYSAFSLEEEARAGWTITYNRVTDSWFVHSGRKEDRIFYEKTILVCDSRIVNSVWIEYPSDVKTRFDPIVERTSASLRHEKADACG
jgi:hypothetical protein